MINKDDFISIEENIQKKIIKERQEDYGDYEENFALLAEMLLRITCDYCDTQIILPVREAVDGADHYRFARIY